MSDIILPALLFLLAIELAAFAVWPLLWRVCDGLPARGYVASKVAGPLALAFGIWLLGMLGWLGLLRGTLLVFLAVLAALCWWAFGRDALGWLRAHRAIVLRAEGLFLALFVLGVAVRMFNAAILGQEKFMDMALMNAFASADRIPTDDPWLAGYGVPYYHFSYLLLALLGRLAGLRPEVGYPLALVYVFAAAGALAGALVANLVALVRAPAPPEPALAVAPPPAPHGGSAFDAALTRGGERTDGDGVAAITPPTQAAPTQPAAAPPPAAAFPLGAAALGAFFVMLAGNLVAPLELLAARGFGSAGFWQTLAVKGLRADPNPGGLLPADGTWWFRASRVVPNIQPDGINEFPFFSFLLGDLHPHYTALPLDLLVLLLALNLLLSHTAWRSWLQFGAASVALGSLVVANTWDVPTFWVLYLLCGLLAARRLPVGRGRAALARLGGTFAAGLLLFFPYFIGLASPPLGLGIVRERTPLVSLLIIFGPLFLLLAFGLRWLWVAGYGRLGLGELRRLTAGQVWALVPLPLLILLALVFAREGTLLLLFLFAFALVPLALGLLFPPARPTPRHAALQFLGLLCVAAIAILLAVEAIYLSDAFGTRMNTVFKFHYEVWLLLGLAGGCFAALALRRVALPTLTRPAFGPGLAFGRLALVLGVVLGLAYPLAATYAKSDAFRDRPTLDGAAFLAERRPGDSAAVAWLRAAPQDRPVVVEAVGNDYSESGRISTFSGAPTVLGWIGHELQWRGPIPELDRRRDDVKEIYSGTDRGQVAQLLRQYRVRYVVVGELEREAYGQSAGSQLGTWLPIAFQSAGTVIYRVPDAGTLAAAGGGS